MADEKQVRQFGLWESPITPASIARGIRLSDVQWSPDGETLVWREERSGVGVLVCQRGDRDAPVDLTDDLNVRARVSYGGGDFTLTDGAVFFVEQTSGRIYRQSLSGGRARPITPPFGNASSPAVSRDGRWVVYVHSSERVDRIAIVDAEGRGWPEVIVDGHDFFMQPAWSPDGRRLAWVAWDHPLMPWDGSRVFVASLDSVDGAAPRIAGEPAVVAGGDHESVFQPTFTPDGRAIAYVTDESGWSRLVVRDLATGDRRSLGAERDEAEYGTAAWIQGLRTYAILPDAAHVFVCRSKNGFVDGSVATFESGAVAPHRAFAGIFTDVEQPAANPVTGAVAAIVASPTSPPRVVVAEPFAKSARIVRRSASENVPAGALAVPEAISWPSIGGALVHGLFYPPASADFESDGPPPLVVIVHGGPTSQASATWSPQTQFLATRGYAVLAVNYRGSTGYGRAYMLALRGQWGVADVDDCVSGARSLAASGRVDGSRMAIMGGSAGGYTVLQTMINHPEVFAAGVSMFGVANQFTLVAETHKFEERYTDSLIGALPQAASVYRERSPQYRAAEIRRPMAIFQGEIDEVVPKNQSDVIVKALERSGTPHEYHVYPGEGHGWRKAETIETFYTSLERFLKQYLIYS